MNRFLLTVVDFFSLQIGKLQPTLQQFNSSGDSSQGIFKNKTGQKTKMSGKTFAFGLILLFSVSFANAATRTASVSGNWSDTATWGGASIPTAADAVVINNGITVTVTAAAACTSITFTGASATLTVNSTVTLSVGGAVTLNSAMGGNTAATITGAGTLSCASVSVGSSVIPTQNRTTVMTSTISNLNLSGNLTITSNRSIGGNINSSTFTETSGIVTVNGVITPVTTNNAASVAAITLGNSSPTLLLGNVTPFGATGNAGGFTTTLNGTGATVNYNRAGDQTARVTAYTNLILSGSGAKTFATTPTVNGVLSLEGTATVTVTGPGAVTYGTNATLQYNKPAGYTATAEEWITPFVATGGVIIANTGVITMDGAKTFGLNSPLTINNTATLATNDFGLTFGGNFIKNGTGAFTAGGSAIIITNTMATQSIAGFTTTGNVSMTKTGGTATFIGDVNGAGLTINGNGGALNLGSGLTHAFTGSWTRTNGTLNGGSSLLKIGGNVSGTGGTFTANTGTVEWYAAGNQTVAGVTYNNLTLSGSGTKTAATTVNGILSMEGTALISAAPTYGGSATLQYNTATARPAGVEWINTFAAIGGVVIVNSGAITMNGAKAFGLNSPLTINNGATLATSNFGLTFGGNFIKNGTGGLTAGSSAITIANTMVTQSIAGFTTTGNVSMTKDGSNKATFTGNVNAAALIMTGTNGGRLALGNGLTHTFTGNWTMTSGTLEGNTSTLKVGGNITNSGGSFSADTGTVELYANGNQNLGAGALPLYNLTLSGNGTKTFGAARSVGNNFSIASGVVADLSAGLTHSANSLTLNGAVQNTGGSWGSTTSSATNKNNTYFAATTGIVNVTTGYCTFSFANVIPITNVVFNSITNASSALTTSQAYENYTNYKTNVIAGQSYPITVQGNTDGNYQYNYNVFFDWNKDGDFGDSGEYFPIGTITNSNGVDGKQTSVSIPVPMSATLGATRMRIISHYNTYNTTPCASIDGNSYGQVEDYSINIEAACSGTPAPGNTVATANPVCPNVPFTLSLQNATSGGATYQWETSPDGTAWTSATPVPVTIINSDFSAAPSNGALIGGSTSITGGELILTPNINDYRGAYYISTSPGSNITPFTASFDYRAWDGTAADGLSLSYGPDINSSSTGGGEEGEGSGFILKLDTYDNVTGVGTGSMIRIFYGGVQVFANSLNPFNLRNGGYRNVTLTVDATGYLSLKIAGTTIVSGLSVPDYVAADKTNWKFKFSGRTGGQTDKHSIDKMLIQCGDVLSSNPLFVTSQSAPTYYRCKVTCGVSTGTSNTLLVALDPPTPTIAATTQPNCITATGSVDLSSLPSTLGWTLYQNGTSLGPVTATTRTVSGLAAGSYVFIVDNGTCASSPANVTIVATVTKTWNVSWTPSAPTINDAIIFDGDYSSATNLEGCSCVVNSGKTVTILSGGTLTITNAVTTTGGTLIFENNASLVQTNNAAINTGDITYKRTSSAMKDLDYTYWSSPVTGQKLNVLSPGTTYDNYYSFTANKWDRELGTTDMVPARGYIIRVPKVVSGTYKQPVEFKGVPNNGNQTFAISTAGNYYLIGNPYPSAINANDFLSVNSTVLNGTLYFWTHNTAIASKKYSSNDYATFNGTGGAAVSGGVAPLGNIAAGQSFFVQSKAAGTVNFTNAVRVAGVNDQFFRMSTKSDKTAIEKNRIWLNLTNTEGLFKQMLVGYVTGATNDFDSSFDGASFDGNTFADFYSVNQGKNLTIQGKALPFDATDLVPLGYRSTIDGSFTIAISSVDGLFGNSAILIEDKITQITHDLKKGPYNFTSLKGTFNDRFVLKYTDKTLGIGDFDKVDNQVVVAVKNREIKINSFVELIDKVVIYDLLGKQVYNKNTVDSKELQVANLNVSQQVLIVKITLQNGVIVTKKIIF